MVDFFNRIYSIIDSKNVILEKTRINTLFRVFIRFLANIIIPIYFRVIVKNIKPIKSKEKSPRIIVSLTTFPARIKRVWLVVVCILLQNQRPDLIVLWLSKKQFVDENELPKKLLKLRKYGLKIVLCNNDMKSHKKYLYAFEKYPNDIIITVDDDVFYDSEIISKLIDINNKYPTNVCANHAVFIGSKNSNLLPYIEWENVEYEIFNRDDVMPIGIGGVLYPPNVLFKDVLDCNLIKDLCFNADDLWLNAMARLNGINVSKSNYDHIFLPIINYSRNELTKINVTDGLNDKQISSIREYYIENINKDPFINS